MWSCAQLQRSSSAVCPDSGARLARSYVCTRESFARPKSSPRVGPLPGARDVMPRARRVWSYVVGSVDDACAGFVRARGSETSFVEARVGFLRFASTNRKSHCRRILRYGQSQVK